MAVDVRNISFAYSKSDQVLSNVSMQISAGSIYGLLGPSGCGKTTLLKCILGSLQVTQGQVRIFGHESGSAPCNIPGNGVGYMPQDVDLYDHMTIYENIVFYARIYGNVTDKANKIAELVRLLDIPACRMCNKLSGGQRRRASLCMALVHSPPLLILDEPTVGVDPRLRVTIWNYLTNLRQEKGTAIIITTHYIEEARRADVVGFMRQGRMLCQDTVVRLLHNYAVNTLEECFAKICMKQETHSECVMSNAGQSTAGVEMDPIANVDEPEGIKRKNFSQWFVNVKTLAWKNLLADARNPIGSALVVIFTCLAFTLSLMIYGQDMTNIALGVINEESDPFFSTMFIDQIDRNVFAVSNYTDERTARRDIESRMLWGYIHIRTNFTDSLADRITTESDLDNVTMAQSEVTIHADVANGIVSKVMLQSLKYSFDQFLRSAHIALHLNPDKNKIFVIGEVIYGSLSSTLSMKSFFYPVIVTNVCSIVMCGIAVMTIINELSLSLYQRNRVAGVTLAQVVVSYVLTFLTKAFINIVIVMLSSFYIVGIESMGSLWLLSALFLSYTFYMILVGVIFFLHTQSIILAISFLFGCIPSVTALSGGIWPFEAMPVYLAWIEYISPTVLYFEVVRAVMLKGYSIFDGYVQNGFALIALHSVIIIAFIVLSFKMKK